MAETQIGLSADNPRRVHVLPLNSFKHGQTYEGWYCRDCTYFIAIDQSWPEIERIPAAHFIAALCPQCNRDRLGTWAGREKWQYFDRPPPKT
jgi:hypothetical protein